MSLKQALIDKATAEKAGRFDTMLLRVAWLVTIIGGPIYVRVVDPNISFNGLAAIAIISMFAILIVALLIEFRNKPGLRPSYWMASLFCHNELKERILQ